MLFNCPTYGWNVGLCDKKEYLSYFWDIPIGITRGLDGCEGKTIKAIYQVTVEIEIDDWDRDIDTYFIEFTDGDRRLLAGDRARLRSYEVEKFLESGFITKDEAQAIVAGRAAVEAEHREQSIAAAEAADRAAYERLKARYEP